MFTVYQSKPRQIEAVQFTYENKDRVFNALTGQYAHGFEDDKPIIKVTTIHGEIATIHGEIATIHGEIATIHGEIAIVRLGDWIVKEEKLGFYYPIKDDVFNDCYS
jgi:hypothetical protein